MNRWKIVALYTLIGPPIGGLVVAAGTYLYEPLGWAFLPLFIATCLLFSFPYGVLAALCDGVAHALLQPNVSSPRLVLYVCIASVVAHCFTALMLGSFEKATISFNSFFWFALPPLFSAACLATVLSQRLAKTSSAKIRQ